MPVGIILLEIRAESRLSLPIFATKNKVRFNRNRFPWQQSIISIIQRYGNKEVHLKKEVVHFKVKGRFNIKCNFKLIRNDIFIDMDIVTSLLEICTHRSWAPKTLYV